MAVKLISKFFHLNGPGRSAESFECQRKMFSFQSHQEQIEFQERKGDSEEMRERKRTVPKENEKSAHEAVELVYRNHEEFDVNTKLSEKEEFDKIQLLHSREWIILAKSLDKIFLVLYPLITLGTVCGYMYFGYLELHQDHL